LQAKKKPPEGGFLKFLLFLELAVRPASDQNA